ncbi:hypothetical protein D3C72_1831400 [compost metagenome]
MNTERLKPGGMLARDRRRNRAAVDDNSALFQRFGHTCLEQHFAHGLAIAQHGDDDIGTLGGLRRRCCENRTIGNQSLGLINAAVPDRNRKAGAQKTPGHRPAHQARADKGDRPLLLLPANTHFSEPPSSSSI